MGQWIPDVKAWDKIPLSSYEVILTQAKERFEDSVSESESITNKSIKFLSIISVAGAAFLTYALKQLSPGIWWDCALIICFVGVYATALYTLFELISPKKVVLRGTRPSNITWSNYDKDYSDESKKVIVYYEEISRYEDKIVQMDALNKKRQRHYANVFIYSFVMLVLSAIITFSLLP